MRIIGARTTRRHLVLAAALIAGLPIAAYVAAPAAAGPVAQVAAPGSHLAGFNTSATSAGAQIELLIPGVVPLGDVTKGNFIQASVPFATSNASTGPQNTGVASPAWPGDAAATAGNALQTFEPNLPIAIVNLLNDPIVARSAFPGQVNAKTSASFNPSGPAGVGTATTTSAAGGTASSAVVTNLSPLGAAKATGTSLLQVASATSTTTSTVGAAAVSTTADTHIGKITVAGLVTIDGIDSTAVAGSDGRHGTKSTDLKIGHVSVAGLDASIGPNGLTLSKKGLLGQLGVLGIANKALKALTKVGITIRTIAPTSAIHGKNATATSGAIQITFEDANLPDIGKLVPSAPVPLPSSFGFTIDVGLSEASAAATLLPAFVNPPVPKVSPTPTQSTTGPTGPTVGGTSPGGGDNFPTTPTDRGSTSTGPTGTTPIVAGPQAATAFGLPIRTAWVVISFMLALLLAGLLLSYAKWQLLRGRTP